ncbi:hypothetical protein HPB50_012306 [Hyalomma asiaticum]|uniref:Uncharacterized protein n=1 Tax=Hyalomma asiaticum TaxID=266040 RepID=A0ACB7RUS0_HYAAI|nr:hypothetical protein HPB50_012306 [Hyalomma asiaticum]
MMFGGLAPSPTHGVHICKILRAEWQYQARVYKEGLYLNLHSMHCPGFAARQFHALSSLGNRTTELIWQRTLPHLRALIPKKSGTSGNFIHTFADVTLSDFARRVLSMGPKFAVPPRSTGPELVTYVRQVSRLADGADAESYLAERWRLWVVDGLYSKNKGHPAANF